MRDPTAGGALGESENEAKPPRTRARANLKESKSEEDASARAARSCAHLARVSCTHTRPAPLRAPAAGRPSATAQCAPAARRRRIASRARIVVWPRKRIVCLCLADARATTDCNRTPGPPPPPHTRTHTHVSQPSEAFAFRCSASCAARRPRARARSCVARIHAVARRAHQQGAASQASHRLHLAPRFHSSNVSSAPHFFVARRARRHTTNMCARVMCLAASMLHANVYVGVRCAYVPMCLCVCVWPVQGVGHHRRRPRLLTFLTLAASFRFQIDNSAK